MTVALPTDKAVADLAIRNEYKRQICELIDDALSVDATVQPVLRECAGSIKISTPTENQNQVILFSRWR